MARPRTGGIGVHGLSASSAPAGLRPVLGKGHLIAVVRGPEQSPSLPKRDFTFIFTYILF